jgi:hypothetical protein
VEKALSNSTFVDTRDTINTWNIALAAKPSNSSFSALADSASRRTKSISLFRGAAAAVALSLIISLANVFAFFALAVFCPLMGDKTELKYRSTIFSIAVFDSLLFAGAIVMFSSAMLIGPAALASLDDASTRLFANRVANQVANHVEIGIVVALVALLCRIMSVPIIALFFLSIVFSEILLIVLVGYVIWKFTVKITENHQPVGC